MTTKDITLEEMLRDEKKLLSDVDTLGNELLTNPNPVRLTPLLVELKEAITDLETLRHEIITRIASTNPLFLVHIMNLKHEN